jgi:ribosomal protein S18 acetylase RimI-like enzyme
VPGQAEDMVRLAEHAYRMPKLFAVVDRERDLLVGDVSVHVVRGPQQVGTLHVLGISLGPDGRGRGLGVQALGLVADDLRRGLGGWIALETAESNAPMRRIALAVGLQEAHSFVKTLPDGSEVPAILYLGRRGPGARRWRGGRSAARS